MDWFLLAFFSAFLSAAAAIAQKKILFSTGALEFSFALSLFSLLFSIPFFIYADYSTITFSALLILYFKTILGALAFWCVMLSIKNLEISGALPLMALTPGLVAIFAFIFLGDSLSVMEILGMSLLLAGTYLLEMRGKQKIFAPFKIFIESENHHYIIYALLLFTVTAILDKALLNKFSLPPVAFMAFQQLFLAINFFIIILFLKKKPASILSAFNKDIFLWIILISLFTIGYRYSQIAAVKIAPVALVLAVKRISVFFATIIGGKIFHEHNLLRKALATAIIVCGTLLLLNILW